MDEMKFYLDWAKPINPVFIGTTEASSLTQGVYMFIDGTSPLLWKPRGIPQPIYIGRSEGRPLSKRISEHLRSTSKVCKHLDKKIRFQPNVTFASITPRTTKTVTSLMLKEIENLLIIKGQPVQCDISNTNYRGRYIEIENAGYYWPLEKKYSVKDLEFAQLDEEDYFND